jgi:hypothetical protein
VDAQIWKKNQYGLAEARRGSTASDAMQKTIADGKFEGEWCRPNKGLKPHLKRRGIKNQHRGKKHPHVMAMASHSYIT